MRSMKLVSAALAAAIAVSGMAALPSSAADVYGSASVSASNAAAKSKKSTSSSSSTSKIDKLISDSGYKTKYTDRYAYKKLSSTEKDLYQKIVTAVKDIESVEGNQIAVPKGVSDDTVAKVYALVFSQEPELFWMGSGVNIINGTLYVSYKTKDYDEIETMQKEINKQTKSLLTKAKKSGTAFGKLKIFYDYIVLNNDFVLSEGGYNSSIYNAFSKSDNLQCIGYAKAMQYLCDLSGIDSMVVTGFNANGESHAWNIVYCGDGYYNLDCTWGDPINDFGSDYITYDFFLVPDSWIKDITHFNVNKLTYKDKKNITLYTPPACTKTKNNYFIKNNINYSSASDAEKALKKQIDEAVKNKKNVVEVRVTTKKLYDQLTGNSYASKFSKYAKSKSKNVKSISKHLTYTKGSFVVHYDIMYN